MKPFNKKIRNLTLILVLLMPIFQNIELFGEQSKERIEISENIKNKEEAKKEIDKLIILTEEAEENNNLNQAIFYLEKIISLEKKFFANEYQEIAETLEWIGAIYGKEGIYKDAEKYFKEALYYLEKNSINEDYQYINNLNSLGVIYHEQFLLDKAEVQYNKALSILEDKGSNKFGEFIDLFYNLGRLYQDKFSFEKSEYFYKKSLEIIEKHYGKKNLKYVDSLEGIASIYYEKGNLEKSKKVYKKALSLNKAIEGNKTNNYLRIATGLGQVYEKMGLIKEAEELFFKILHSQENNENADIATTLNNIGMLYQQNGDYEKAYDYLFKAYEIEKRNFGANHINLATNYNNISINYLRKGELEKAKEYSIKAINLYEKNFGENHPDVARALSNLALIYKDNGIYFEAESLLTRSLEIREKVLGELHPDTAISLNNLGILYINQGLISKGEEVLKRNLEIVKTNYGNIHTETATAFNNLALVYDDPKKSIPLLKKSLKITKAIYGANNANSLAAMSNLALAYFENKEYEKAEKLFLEAIDMDRKILGEKHISNTITMSNLANLYLAISEYKKAEKLLLESLSIRKEYLNKEHPDIASNLIDLGKIYKEKGLIEKAIDLTEKGIKMDILLIQREAPFLSLEDRLNYVSEFNYGYDQAIQFSFKDPLGTKLALFARLNRQGLLEEIEKKQSQLFNNSNKVKGIVNKLKKITEELSFKDLNIEIKNDLVDQKEKLEKKIYRLIPKLKPRHVEIKEVADSLERDSILIEYQKYTTSHNKRGDIEFEDNYLVFLLFPNGEFKVIDLGPAKIIDEKIKKGLLASEKGWIDAQEIWDDLGYLVLNPIIKYIDKIQTIYISPDAELNRVPFTALKIKKNDIFFSEKYNIRLVTTGRELIDLKENLDISKNKSLIVANPAFNLIEEKNYNQKDVRRIEIRNQIRSISLSDENWDPLPGTKKEGLTISSITSGELLLGKDASAFNIQNRNTPKIIHIASHAYYLENQAKENNPLLKSGVVLAGANNSGLNPLDDGYLTALEISKLNWSGTELVVISACESGLGDIELGEGVYGIKRAISVAGAKSSLLSLWKVNDLATAEFMEIYYQKLKSGQGKSEALHNTQKEFRNSDIEGYRHPYYWAAFQLSGDWRPIDF